MINNNDKIKGLLSKETAEKIDDFTKEAIHSKQTYEEFFNKVIDFEWERRENNKYAKLVRDSNIPYFRYLDNFDVTRLTSGLNQDRLNILRKLEWLDKCYNLLLIGPPGLGKSYIAIGLALDALKQNKKVMFITNRELIVALTTETILRKSETILKRIRSCDLLIIDDVNRLFDKDKETELILELVDKLYEKASIIITSNKPPKEWFGDLDDEIQAIATLDRLLHRCEKINIEGPSYRLEHHESIFKD